MKRVIFVGAVLLSFGIIATSCKKEVDSKTEKQIAAKEASSAEFYYIDKDGNQIAESGVDLEADNIVIMVEENSASPTGIAHRYFQSEEEAYHYACDHSINEMKTKIEFVREARELAQRTGDIHISDPKKYSPEMKKLLATYQPAGQMKSFGALYDNNNGTGDYHAIVGVPIPGLGKFKNKASSYKGVGLAAFIWPRTWFRGSSLYLHGNGSVFNIETQSPYHNNNAESAF